MILSFQDKYYAAQALEELLPSLGKFAISFKEWSQLLNILSHQKREKLLLQVPYITSIVLNLSDEQAFSRTLQGMRDVCAQWP